MSNNLPPGCSSADGGIDHALETALESLCEQIETAEEAAALEYLLPGLRLALNDSFKAGHDEARMWPDQRTPEQDDDK